MGCDGGTIPKRNEIVKNKQKDKNRDKNADLSAKWQFCSLSGLRLKKPIVSCQLGQLYNKDAIIQYLLEYKLSGGNTTSSASSSSTSTATSSTTTLSHIKSLKDVKELKLKEKGDYDSSYQATKGNEQFKAQYLCPITGLELNGKYKFYYLIKCGCVFSERALKQVAPDERSCLVCSQPYDPELDLIVLNGDKEEVDELREKLQTRRRRLHQNKVVAKKDHGKKCIESASASSRHNDKEPDEKRAHQDIVGPSKRFKSETVR